MNDPLLRPANVDWLVAAYRAKYLDRAASVLADQVLANQHLDFTPEECRAARLQALELFGDDELEDLIAAGLLDDMGAS